MADTVTANYSWIKPEVGASTSSWGGKLNADMDGIDAQVFAATTTANSAQTNAANASTAAAAAQTTANQALNLAQNPQAPQGVLMLSGGTMLGLLTLAGQGTGSNDAATKGYVDSIAGSASGSFLPLTGGTISGSLGVNGSTALAGASASSLSVNGSTTLAGVTATAGVTGVGVITVNRTGAAGTAVDFYNSGTHSGNIFVSGGTTSYVTTSDVRLKEDARSFDAGPIIDAVTAYDFKWKERAARAHGIMAQEAAAIYPEAVTYDEEGDWWGVDYSKFVPLLLEEIKALRRRVAALEARAP